MVDTVELLKGRSLTAEEYRSAAILGWCIELLQAYFLVAVSSPDFKRLSSLSSKSNVILNTGRYNGSKHHEKRSAVLVPSRE